MVEAFIPGKSGMVRIEPSELGDSALDAATPDMIEEMIHEIDNAISHLGKSTQPVELPSSTQQCIWHFHRKYRALALKAKRILDVLFMQCLSLVSDGR